MSKYIKLEDAIEQVKTEFPYPSSENEWLEIKIDNLINRLANIPSADVAERKRGEWINYYQDGICHFVGTCSVCGNRNDIPPIESAQNCPSCGAKMKGADDERV